MKKQPVDESDQCGFGNVDQELAIALVQLTKELREVILLIDIVGYKAEKAAETLGLSTFELERRLKEGRVQLKKLLSMAFRTR